MRIPALPIEIETERLSLHPWRPEEALPFYQAIRESAERVGKWLPWVQYHTEPAVADFFIQQTREGWANATELILGIFDRRTGAVLGGTGLHSAPHGSPLRWDWGSFETGYWLRDGAEGHGYMREAVRAQMRLVFGHFGAHKLSIRCDARNEPSRRVAESLGFKLDVQARNDSIATDGTVRSSLIFSLLAVEAAELMATWDDEYYRLVFDPAAPPIDFDPPSNHEEPVPEAERFPRPLRIESDRLILRRMELSDAPAWLAVVERSRADLERWMSDFRRVHTLAEAEHEIGIAMADAENRARYDLFAFERDTGELIGGGALHGFAWNVPAVEIDWWLDSQHTGKGYATEIGGMQAQFALDAWGANRIEVWAEPGNAASTRVADRLGMQYEGIARAEYPNADGTLSAWSIYSLIPSDLRDLAKPLPAITYTTD